MKLRRKWMTRGTFPPSKLVHTINFLNHDNFIEPYRILWNSTEFIETISNDGYQFSCTFQWSILDPCISAHKFQAKSTNGGESFTWGVSAHSQSNQQVSKHIRYTQAHINFFVYQSVERKHIYFCLRCTLDFREPLMHGSWSTRWHVLIHWPTRDLEPVFSTLTLLRAINVLHWITGLCHLCTVLTKSSNRHWNSI